MKQELLRINRGKSAQAVRFPVQDLHMQILSGEVDVLLCENWDTKETICRFLAGREGFADGVVILHGEDLSLAPERPILLPQGRIVMLEPDHLLTESLSVAENLFLQEKTVFRTAANDRMLQEKAADLLARFDVAIDASVQAGMLDVLDRLRVELLRRFCQGTRIVVVDEPARFLKLSEVRRLFRLIDALRREGMAFLFVTTTRQIIALFRGEIDVITIVENERTSRVLRGDGRDTEAFCAVQNPTLHTGKTEEIAAPYASGYFTCSLRFGARNDPIRLRLGRGELHQFVFESRRRMMEFRQILTGENPAWRGYMCLDGTDYSPANAREAIDARVCWMDPNDLHGQLFEKMSIYDNIVLARGWNFWGIQTAKYKEHIKSILEQEFQLDCDLDTRLEEVPASVQEIILYLKWRLMSPRILLIEKPFALINEEMRQIAVRMITRFLEKQTTVIVLTGQEDPIPELPWQGTYL